MANLSYYGSDVLADVHNPDNIDNNVINQSVQYVHETQQAAIQNSNSSAQQDALIFFVIEQLKPNPSCRPTNVEVPKELPKVSMDVEQHRLESKKFEIKMNQVSNENGRLLAQVINRDIVNIVVNSYVDSVV
nr:hypothetical protein [Tanacetum cinerariifolium]